jgi:hypothetical protein
MEVRVTVVAVVVGVKAGAVVVKAVVTMMNLPVQAMIFEDSQK